MSGNPFEPTPSTDGAETVALSPLPGIHARAESDTLTQEQIKRTYAWYAPIYDQLFGAVYAHGRRRMAAALRTLAPQRVLEVGVGTGLTLNCYPATSSIVGIDLSEPMLARARRRATRLGLTDVDLRIMDGESTPFPDASFDCVTVPYVLSATPEPARLVRELRRVCRPGGNIVILNHFSGSRFWWLLERAAQPLSSKVGFRSDFHFEEHVARHDWKILSVESANPFGLSRLVVIENV
ncbi:MAG TPA: methyltransferase domain-containing protein [Tahibacter sp.]|uniref:class I SAM-dependent methyltransferase n=1 Tax=Tahibacter sp. TaxID=2056211 RepID=UPI002C3FCD7F|nr:methyltransferase domain-containing protein [Tahibacter sp.]HSX59786.1 methyltransferase domain-containing protein [Tahibacter sp.]